MPDEEIGRAVVHLRDLDHSPDAPPADLWLPLQQPVTERRKRRESKGTRKGKGHRPGAQASGSGGGDGRGAAGQPGVAGAAAEGAAGAGGGIQNAPAAQREVTACEDGTLDRWGWEAWFYY